MRIKLKRLITVRPNQGWRKLHALVKSDKVMLDASATGLDPVSHHTSFGKDLKSDIHALFSPQWYLERYPDIQAAGVNPLDHYLQFGAFEGRDPHLLFSTQWYLERYTDVQAAGVNPLEHYLQFGAFEGRDPHPLFSTRWYLACNTDVAAAGMNPLVHFLLEGATQGREPHPLFDSRWYLAQCGSTLPANTNPLAHYIKIGSKAALSPHPLFDARAYLNDNPDVAKGGYDPLSHFLIHGGREGRNPHKLFQVNWYLDQNPHVAGGLENALVHYVTKGAFEGCDPNPVFDNVWYLEQNAISGFSPLAHYVAIGAAEGRMPNPDFDAAWYAQTHAEGGRPLDEPLAHYLYQGRERDLQTKPIVARNPIAVVFLARSADGSTKGLDRFAQSYKQFASGLPHDLIVIRKGQARIRGARQAIELMLEGVDVQYVDLNDVGFDIHAYLKTAAILPHEFVCFLNSYAEITGGDWLKKLRAPLLETGVGLTGATASYESLSDTLDIYGKVVWLANRNELPPDAETVRLFRTQLEAHAPSWLTTAEERLAIGDTNFVPERLGLDREVDFGRFWLSVTKPGGPLHYFEGYRRFPNPHIRTSGFMIRRSLLLSFEFSLEDTKEACNRFESGPGGLPDRLAELGLRSILVGADGQAFEVGEWPRSGTFRLGSQHNVLIRDNRVNEFDTFSLGDRELMVQLTWGAFLGPISGAVRRLGFGFERGVLTSIPKTRPSAAGSPPAIAIAIPTHNRVSLVREALSTLVSQTYPHWTCTVFDNASTEPLREVIDALSDTRISYTRSDQFLPVTDSWNNAIDLARGDYILLIGDDDGLAPRALETIAEVARVYENPDVIYSALYQFFHPGVAPWEPSGSVSRLRYGFFFSDRSETFRLDPKAARLAVTGSLEFRRNFTFNMQAFFFRRGFLDSLRRGGGKVFQSPFPDYYLANVALGLAQDIVVLPDPVSIAGVSRKSFGYTLFNNLSEKGDSLLGTDLSQDRLYSKFSKYKLHGPSYDTNYALTMEHVEDALGSAAPTRINVGRYRRLQIFKSLGEMPGLLGDDEKVLTGYEEYVRPHLSTDELGWAEDLIRLGRCAAQGEAQALSTINRVAATVSMAAPAELAVHAERLSTGEFDSLPRLFAALRAGRLGRERAGK